MIPKRLIFFWTGEYMSWLRYMTLYSARMWNPDWDIILYIAPTSKNKVKPWPTHNLQDSFYFDGPNYFNKVLDLGIRICEWDTPEGWGHLEPAQKCDIFQWQIMYEYGGFFCDMDILFTQQLDSLYDKICEHHNTVICYHDYFSIGFMAGHNGNKFYKDLYDHCFNIFHIDNYQVCGVTAMYNLLSKGKFYSNMNNTMDFHAELMVQYPDSIVYNLDRRNFYNWGYKQLDEIYYRANSIPSQVYGIHWYGGAPQSKEWNLKLNENTYRDYGNTLCLAMRGLL